jgi:NodT family efflux transporter outer membrane factor (OMF) lipoprotein
MKVNLWAWGAGAILLAGCNAGPSYVRPRLTLAGSYSGLSANPAETREEARAARAPGGPPSPDLAHWWEALHDPELNSLLGRAVAGNLDLEVAIDRLQQSRAILARFGGEELPSFHGSGVAGRGTGNNLAPGGAVDGPLAQSVNTSGLKEVNQVLGVDTEFDLDLFGELRRAHQAVAADAAAAAEFRNQVVVALLGSATRTYVDIRTLQRRVALAEQAIEVERRAADLERQRYERGIANELDSALADREVESTEAALAPLQARLLVAERDLAVLLGEAPDTLFSELAAGAPLPVPPAEIDPGLPIDLLRRRPDVRQAEAQLVAANARLGVATAQLYPHVSLMAAAGFQGQEFSQDPHVSRGIWSVAPSFHWPLLDFGTVDAAIQAQNQATRAQAAHFRQVVLAAMAEVDNDLTGYDAEHLRLDHLGRAVTDGQRAYDLATRRYNRGIIDYLNVLDAQRALYALQDQQAVSAAAAVSDFVTVCQSLGGGWEGFAPPPPLRRPLPALLATIRDLTGNSDHPLAR